MDNDWIKDYRKATEWGWYKDVPTCHLFFHLLRTANWKKGKFQQYDIPAGGRITGRKTLSFETGLTEQQIRTALEKLKSTNEITIKTTNSFSIIVIQNWDKYQQQITNEITNEEPTDNQRITTIEESNKGRRGKNKDTIPTDREFFENEIKRITDPALSNSLREWWKYKKGKYTPEGWQKQITICLKYSPKLVCNRIDEAIASGWKGMNLSTVREDTGSAPPVIHRISASS